MNKKKNFEEEVVIQSRAAPNPADKIKDNDGQDHPINATYGDLSKNKRSFYKSNFDNANLSQATLKGNFNIASFKNANLSGANLTGASINGVNSFAGANLKDVIANGVSFVNTILKGVGSLQNARLEKSNLYKVDLTSADLTGANLDNANLNGTKLVGVKLTNAILRNAIFTSRTQYSTGTKWPEGFTVPNELTKAGIFEDIKLLALELENKMIEVVGAVNKKFNDHRSEVNTLVNHISQEINLLKTKIDTVQNDNMNEITVKAFEVTQAVKILRDALDTIDDNRNDTNIGQLKQKVNALEECSLELEVAIDEICL